MPSKKILFLLLLALSISFCVPSKKVIRKGVLMPEDQAAKLDYTDIKKDYGIKKKSESLELLKSFVKKYPDHSLSAFALLKISQIYLASKKYDEATKSLENLIFNFPMSSPAVDAKYYLGKLYIATDKYEAAKSILSSINLKSFPKNKQISILKNLRKALIETDSYEDLVYCDISLYDLHTEFSTISLYKSEIFQLIESRLTQNQLLKLSKQRDGSFPADLALFKLSKISYHIRNYSQAKNYLSSLLRNYPYSEYYMEAMELYNRVTLKRSPSKDKIGVVLPLSGENSAVGQLALQGILLASKLTEKTKGPYDRVELIIKDSAGDPDTATSVFEELIFEDGVIGVIGPMLTKTSQTLALKAEEHEVPVILINQNEDITQIGHYVFRNFITKKEQAKILTKFAVENIGIRKFAFLYPMHSYGTGFVEYFWDEISKYKNVEVKGIESYDPLTNDFSVPIKKLTGLYDRSYREDEICKEDPKPTPLAVETEIKKCFKSEELPPVIDFEAIVIPDNYEKIIQIAPSLVYYDIKAIQLIGGNLWNTENIFKEGTAKYLQGAIFTDAFFKKSSNPAVKSFATKFQKIYEREPEIISSQAYEAASVMLQATQNYMPTDSSSLRDILGRTKDFQTLSGNTFFSQDGDLNHNLSILVIDGDEIKELY